MKKAEQKIYRFPVMIRYVGNMGSPPYQGCVNGARLMTLPGEKMKGIGCYVCAGADLANHGYLPAWQEGFVVLQARDEFEALSKFFRHPGVMEGKEKKAIELRSDKRIQEMPDCFCNCFSVNEKGWAMCQSPEAEEDRKYNDKIGYCVLLQAEGIRIGCSHEEYLENGEGKPGKIKTIPAITFQRHNVPDLDAE